MVADGIYEPFLSAGTAVPIDTPRLKPGAFKQDTPDGVLPDREDVHDAKTQVWSTVGAIHSLHRW